MHGHSDAAPPLGAARQTSSENCSGTRRLRRRGPRSVESIARRAERYQRKCPQEIDSGKSRIETPTHELKMQPLIVLCINIRSLMGKLGELVTLVERLEANLIFIQESWLDASVVNPVVRNFYVLSRRDRNEKSNRGGSIIYARGDLNNVIAFKKCAGSERLWCLVQRDSSCVVFVQLIFASRR